ALKRLERTEDIKDRAHVYAAGHENFLLRSITYTYLYGDIEQARRYYAKVREMFGDRPSNIRTGRYRQSLEDLVLQDLGENLENWDRTIQFIDAMFNSAFRDGLANNRGEVFDHFLRLAKRVHEKFEKRAIPDPR